MLTGQPLVASRASKLYRMVWADFADISRYISLTRGLPAIFIIIFYHSLKIDPHLLSVIGGIDLRGVPHAQGHSSQPCAHSPLRKALTPFDLGAFRIESLPLFTGYMIMISLHTLHIINSYILSVYCYEQCSQIGRIHCRLCLYG